MTLEPLAQSPALVQAHAAAAFAALGLGGWQFLLPKGTPRHRIVGWLWIGCMAAVALSSFGIARYRQFGSFSLIHGLSLVTLVMLAVAVAHARAGRIAQHRWTMIGIFSGALVVTGLFTLLPGRVMNAVFFGG